MASNSSINDYSEETNNNSVTSEQIDPLYKAELELIEQPSQTLDNQWSQTEQIETNISTNNNGETSNDSSNKQVYRRKSIRKTSLINRQISRPYPMTVKMPEIEFDLVLDFSNPKSSNLADLLTIGSRCLHYKLKQNRLKERIPSVYIDYQIEILPLKKNSSDCKLFLRVDPDLWYKLHMFDEDIELKVKEYIAHVQKECIPYEGGIITGSQQQASQCPTSVICKQGKPCQFYACKNHIIYMERGVWYAVARCKQHPVLTIYETEHYNNEQWVERKDTWRIFCCVIDKLMNDLQLHNIPFERVYINFGRWLTQAKGSGLNPDQCHAHMNIVLTKEVIDRCTSGPAHLHKLQYSTNYPVDHRLDDVNELCRNIESEGWRGEEMDISSDVDDEVSNKILDHAEKWPQYQ